MTPHTPKPTMGRRLRQSSGRSRLDRAVGDWLRAELEAAGPEGADPAETRLTEVFRRLGPPVAAVDLAPAIFARLGLALPASRRDPFAAWGLRGLIAAAVVLCASALALAPVLWTAASALFRPSAAAELVSGAIVVSAGRFAQGVELWQVLHSVAGALAQFATHPPVIAALTVAGLIAGGAFQTLNRLITSERSV